jgi:hypothetical protein
MSSHEQTFDDDPLENAWPALGWIILAAVLSITAFLLAPMP